MSVFSEAKSQGVIDQAILDMIQTYGAPVAWHWFKTHQNDIIFQKKGSINLKFFKIPYSVSFEVGEARWLVERFFGPEPVNGILPGVP
jgi:hypothetical protein